MKTIFVDLQYSAISNGKFLVLSDSNFDVNFSFFKHLTKDFRIIFTLPDDRDIFDSKSVIEKLNCAEIKPVFIERQLIPFNERFNINLKGYEEAISVANPDVLYCNNPSTVAQLKLFAPKAKIITYNHWIDSSLYPKDPNLQRKMSYNIRQCEGHLLSDYVFLNSNFAARMLIQALQENFNERMMDDVDEKIFIFPPTDVFEPIEKLPLKKYDSNIIVFNHRLSSFSYYQQNFEDCFSVIQSLSADYHLACTDSSGKGIPKSADFTTYLGTLSDENLNKALWESSVHLSLFRFGNGGMWSISIMRAIKNLNAIILPNHSGYKEMVPPNYPGLVENTDMAIDVLKAFKNLDFRKTCAMTCYEWFRKTYDMSIYIECFKKLLNE